MVNELKELLRRTTESAPADHLDLAAVLSAGRSRARRRRLAVGGAALATAGIVAVTAIGGMALQPSGPDAATGPPRPDAPTITFADAQAAVEGRDFKVLATNTNEDLAADNGQYLDGVTDDGVVLFRDGPRFGRLSPRFALLDPATDEKDWLPRLEGVGQNQTWPVDLGVDRLVLMAVVDGVRGGDIRGIFTAYVFDRDAREWRTMQWPSLPEFDVRVGSPSARMGPDDRLYVLTAATRPQPPEGGWSTRPDGTADEADAEGATNHLWSVSLTDPTDVRDEQLTVGSIAFTDTAMIWTDAIQGDPGLVHVRDLATGDEHEFDPQTGERCNLLSFGASGDRIVMSQYCGTYEEGRDDRVQIVTPDGDQVVTIQGDGLIGSLPPGSGVVNVTAFLRKQGGTYVFDLESDRLLRIGDEISGSRFGGPAGGARQFMWATPLNDGRGATQHIGELL